MMLTVHYYNHNGKHLINATKVRAEDAEFFRRNNLRVSMEELSGSIIVYGCPYEDESEESEVIVFSGEKSCEDTLAELASLCRETYGVK
jgi:hypothetical protein